MILDALPTPGPFYKSSIPIPILPPDRPSCMSPNDPRPSYPASPGIQNFFHYLSCCFMVRIFLCFSRLVISVHLYGICCLDILTHVSFYTFVYTPVHSYILVYTHTHSYTLIYTYIHAYTLLYTHLYTLILMFALA